jgi:serpin B
MTRLTLFLALGTAFLLVACVVGADAQPTAKLPADVDAVVKGDTEFALDLYARLRAREGNLFFSPSSISTALAMTYAGARGETATQMAKTLHISLPQDRLSPATGSLLQHLNRVGQKQGSQLNVANALWGQLGYHFRPEFLKLTRDSYGAGLNQVDFARQPEAARQTINAWVEKQTRDKIKELLQPDVITADARLVLTNAIYFKGDWARKFKKELTKSEPFQVTPSRKVDVPMMRQVGDFQYLDGGDFQALGLPYRGNDLSMVVLLPKKADGLAALEKSLTAAKLTECLKKLRTLEVGVILPKFRLTRDARLGQLLSAMGMPLAFRTDADFSGMTGKKELMLSEVVHKAFVEVNEEGTEAAAATAVVAQPTAARIPPTFQADHPFVFLIRDNATGSILFLGRVTDPQR